MGSAFSLSAVRGPLVRRLPEATATAFRLAHCGEWTFFGVRPLSTTFPSLGRTGVPRVILLLTRVSELGIGAHNAHYSWSSAKRSIAAVECCAPCKLPASIDGCCGPQNETRECFLLAVDVRCYHQVSFAVSFGGCRFRPESFENKDLGLLSSIPFTRSIISPWFLHSCAGRPGDPS